MTPRLLGRARLAVPAALALVALAACGSSNTGTSAKAAGSSSTKAAAGSSAPAGTATDLGVSDSSLGRVIVNGKKMTAYSFTQDTPNSGKSACTGACLQAWPPITTTSASPSAKGVTGKVGTITRTDGSKQVTVNGRPLYLFAKDAKPGDVLGQGVGSVWYVVGADGTMVTDQGSGSSGY